MQRTDAAIQQESVAKARRNPDCMAGRDFRDQNEAKKCEKTRFRKAVGEVLNPSQIGGKAYAEATIQSRSKHSCPGEWGGRDRTEMWDL